MSGYLEVKYPFKSNLGLNPFKSWKKQWCILRPSATCGGGSLAVYCSEAGAPAGTVDLPSGCIVKRAKSRTRPHAFAVFSVEEPCKPRVLLAATSHHDAQHWMDKIRNLLNTENLIDEGPVKDSFSVTVLSTELSKKCGLSGADCSVTVGAAGLLVAKPRRLATLLPWPHLVELRPDPDDKNICVLTLDSGFSQGSGVMKLSSPLAGELAAAVRSALRRRALPRAAKLSRSEGDLRSRREVEAEEARRSSWYSGPSEVSLDDTDLIMCKESRPFPAGSLSLRARALLHLAPYEHTDSYDRRSLVSVASGVYEEIAEEPAGGGGGGAARAMAARRALDCEEPTYESVAECLYATVRRARRAPPPPLPPRQHAPLVKLGEAWVSGVSVGAGAAVTRHSSLGSLPRYCHTRTLPKARQPFSVFRKRLKSDSRLASSPKSENSKEIKDVETKKKKFDFPPPRDIFKSFRVSRKMKNLKIGSALVKGETKSCEFLDDTRHVATNRCSKSVECLEGAPPDEPEVDLSLQIDDSGLAALALPPEIVELILRGRDQLAKLRLKEVTVEGDYVPMSPIVPPPPSEHHYIVMSPRTNLV
ncbi:uncharacterized protein LOC106715722 isoform X2 [Papilio machaon]|uniref:uncharacterized protein LOC106715722 isoform X2 n=1 Tax=Papilio machaon TaxID=76193 RepID=UPI001E665469|nr:uncharacterized protein LOC106715722 isoform X2 [Papilio machaon]